MPATIPNCGEYLVEMDTGTATNQFILGDPIKGVLGQTLYVLGGTPNFVDVTGYLIRFSTSQGRQNPIREESGMPSTATLVFNNNGFQFSVFNTASPFWNATTGRLGFEEGTTVRISRNGEYLFVGSITTLIAPIEMPNLSTCTVSCSDDLYKGNNVKVPPQAVVVERSDQRITKILDSAGMFIGKRRLDVGKANLGLAPLDEGASVTETLRKINNSERGRLFVDRDGYLTFHKRIDRTLLNSIVTLADDGTGVGYQAIEIAGN